MSILKRIIAEKNREVGELKKRLSRSQLEKAAASAAPTRDFRKAISSRSCAIIAEVKRKSPSKGLLRRYFEPLQIASIYEENGAAAASVLTDEPFFGGHGEFLRAIRARVGLPLLRKDFIIDSCQVYEARVLGADAVLLIAAILDDHELEHFIGLVRSLDMSALVEVHTAEERDRAVAAGAAMIGINNRDLNTFQTDINVTPNLQSGIPEGTVIVSESGIHSREDVAFLMGKNVHAFLIGEALMQAEDMGMKLKELLGK